MKNRSILCFSPSLFICVDPVHLWLKSLRRKKDYQDDHPATTASARFSSRLQARNAQELNSSHGSQMGKVVR